MAPRDLNSLRATEALKRAEEVFHMSSVLKMNQYQIAEKLGISQPAVSKILQRGVKARVAHIAEVAQDALAIVEAQHADRYQRLMNVLVCGDGPPLDIDGYTRVIDLLRKESEHYAKLLGLYAPEKREVSGPNGGPISLSNDADVLSQLRAMSPKAREALAVLAKETGVAIAAASDDSGDESEDENDSDDSE